MPNPLQTSAHANPVPARPARAAAANLRLPRRVAPAAARTARRAAASPPDAIHFEVIPHLKPGPRTRRQAQVRRIFPGQRHSPGERMAGIEGSLSFRPRPAFRAWERRVAPERARRVVTLPVPVACGYMRTGCNTVPVPVLDPNNDAA